MFITRFMARVLPDGFHRKSLDAACAALGATGPERHDPASSGAPDETCGEEGAAESLACPRCGAPLRDLREIPAGQLGPGPGRDPPRTASPEATVP